jgi:hypothetical protein
MFFVCLFVCLYSSSVGAVAKFSASFGLNGEVWCLREGKLILLDRCGSAHASDKKSKRCCLLSGRGGVACIELKRFFLTVLFSERSSLYASTEYTGGTHGMWRFCLLLFP